MLRNLSSLIAITAFLLSATATFAAPVHGKRHVVHRWHGYGFLPATVHPSGSNGKRRGIPGESIGMAAQAFIEGAGTAAASAHAGPRPRSAMYGTAVDSGSTKPGQCAAQPIATKRPQLKALRPDGPGIVGCIYNSVRDCSDRRSVGQPQLLADRDAAYSPTVARHDALPNRIANAGVAVVGIVSAVAVRIKAQTPTKPQARAAKAAPTETAMVETATGNGRCAGCSQ